MRVLIIEDESLNVSRLQRILADISDEIEVVGVTTSVKESANWLDSNPHPDVILMDIRLEDGISFDIFNLVAVKSPIIFTTSYDEYAIRAFKVNSLDYLLKPIDKKELEDALKKVRVNVDEEVKAVNKIKDLLKQLGQQSNTYRKRFLVRKYKGQASLNVEEVDFIFSENKISYLFTKEHSKHVVNQTLEDISKELDPNFFFRVNRQYILSVDSILTFHESVNGKLRVILQRDPSREIIVSREKAPMFKTWLDG